MVTHPAPRVGGCCLVYSPCNLLCIYRVPIVVGAVARSVILLCRALPYHCRAVSPYHRCRCISPCIAVVSRRVVAVFTFRLVLPLYLAVLPPCMYYISPWGCPNPIPYPLVRQCWNLACSRRSPASALPVYYSIHALGNKSNSLQGTASLVLYSLYLLIRIAMHL